MPEISARPITKAQIKAIHVALSYHGIPDKEYRERLHTDYGAKSCKDLSRRQASELLVTLGRPLANPPGSQPAQSKTGRRQKIRNPAPKPTGLSVDGIITLASPAQHALIDELAGEVAWELEDGFRRWLKRSLGLERVRTQGDAQRVIDGLRGLKRHGHGKPAEG